MTEAQVYMLLLEELTEYFAETRDKYKMAPTQKFGVDRMNKIEIIVKTLKENVSDQLS